MAKLIECLLLVAMAIQATNSFVPSSSSNLREARTSADVQMKSALFMAGFGGGGGAKGKNKKKKATPIKLKPKLQWDRFEALTKKGAPSVPVGIRLIDEEDSEWLSVGKVKSLDGDKIAAAVAMQRAIIAEHGKRLYPLQVSKKSTCEWGYIDKEGADWTAIDVKAALVDVPDGLEKDIGFEGTPDPATGFYCVYDNGKLKVGEETSFT